MSREWTQEKLEDVRKAIFQRAAIDASFRALCVEDAHAAIKEVSGLDVPEGGQVRFVDPGTDLVLVLPPLAEEEEELSDEDLATAAGGNCHSTNEVTDWSIQLESWCPNLCHRGA